MLYLMIPQTIPISTMLSCRVRSAKRISVESKYGGPIGGGTLEVTANQRPSIT